MVQKYKHKQVAVPSLLSVLPEAPKQLFAIGDGLAELLQKSRVAIVGSRKMTPYGKQVTETIAEQLAIRGVVIVSGLAFGVDIWAHRVALRAGGKCIAVQANGLDTIYPVGHSSVAEQIIEGGGVIVSEYPPGTKPQQYRFLERNRLISGLSDIVVVTEAAARSGTLNTAAHALNQGKPVFAVPGNISNPLSEGVNNLIKAGATPITSLTGIVRQLGLEDAPTTSNCQTATNPEEAIIMELLSKGVNSGDKLLKESGLQPAVFNQTLTMLEISQRIRSLGANNWSIIY